MRTMADIATLGLKIDSSQAKTAATDLDKLTAAAKGTTPAVTALEKAAAGLNVGAKGISAAAVPASAALGKLEKDATKAAASNNKVGASMANMSFQLNDIASGLAMGQSPFTIMAQQGGQVFQIWQMNRDVFKQTGAAILSVVTPTRLLVGGFVGVAAASYLVISRIAETEKKFGELSERTSTTLLKLHAFESAASFKGIDTKEFLSGMTRFGDLTDQAVHGMGSIADLFRANGVAAGSLNDNLFRAADLIKNARTEGERYRLIQQLGLPPTREWVQLLSQGGDNLRLVTEEATKFGGAADEMLVARARAFEEAWNKAWKNFANGAKTSVLDAAGWLESIGDKAASALLRISTAIGRGEAVKNKLFTNSANMGLGERMTQSSANDFYNATGADRPAKQFGPAKPTVDPNALQHALSLEQQRIGLLGQTATVGQQVRAVEIAIAQARLAGVKITNDEADALKRLAEFQAESNKLQKAASYGIFDAGSQAANAAREIKTLYDDKTIKSAADYAAAVTVIGKRIKEASDAAAIARSPFEQLTRFALDGQNPFKQFDQIAVSSLGNLENGLVAFASGTKTAKAAFADMATAILADLQRMIIRMTITAPLAQALGGAFGLGGGFSSLFGGGGAAGGVTGIASGSAAFVPTAHTGYGPGDALKGRYVHPAYFDNAPRFHLGVGPGEQAAIIRKDESVLTPGQMKALGRGQSGGGGASVNITFAPNVTMPANTDAVTVAQFSAAMTAQQRSFKASVPGIVKDAIRNGQI
jgi:hypothetical protein